MKMKDIVRLTTRLKDMTYFSPMNSYTFQYSRMVHTIAEQFKLDIPTMTIRVETYTPGFYYFGLYRKPGIADWLYKEIDNLKVQYGYTIRYKTQYQKTVGYGICYQPDINIENGLWYGVLIT